MRAAIRIDLTFAVLVAGCALGHADEVPKPEPDYFLVVSGVQLNAECSWDAKAPQQLARGRYDVADTGVACRQPYAPFLIFSSNHELDSLAVLQRRYEDLPITLTTSDRNPITFDSPLQHNPFFRDLEIDLEYGKRGVHKSMGIEQVELIPSEYRSGLKRFAGETILASLAIHASGDDDLDDSGEDFQLPIEICDGCLTVCASNAESGDDDTCELNAGADGQICIDPDC